MKSLLDTVRAALEPLAAPAGSGLMWGLRNVGGRGFHWRRQAAGAMREPFISRGVAGGKPVQVTWYES